MLNRLYSLTRCFAYHDVWTTVESANATFFIQNFFSFIFSYLKKTILSFVLVLAVLFLATQYLAAHFACFFFKKKQFNTKFDTERFFLKQRTFICFEHFAFGSVSTGFVRLVRLFENARVMSNLCCVHFK